MTNDISSDNKSQVNELIDEMNIIVFDKIRETVRENRVIRTYKVSLFNSIWYLYDFFYYASKCYDKCFINFVNENHEVVTKQFLTNEFILETENIEKICEENKLKLSMTLYVNNRHWTISKQYGKDEITIMSTLDEKGLDLDKNIGSLMFNYLKWIQSEHICAILNDSPKNSNKIALASGYLLIQYMLELSDEEYNEFYNTNLKWLEKKFDTVSSDKSFWTTLLDDMGKTLVEKVKSKAPNIESVQSIDCFCGQKIQVDWSKIPQTEKVIYITCSQCNSERKIGNPFYKEGKLEITHTYPVSHHIFENFNMCREENPAEDGFFEDTEKIMMEEIERAKNVVTIKGVKLSEYLTLAKTQDQINDIISALGESCIYNRNFDSKEGKFVFSMELDNLDDFRVLLIYNIIGILYHISDKSLPLTVEISMDRRWEEIFEAFMPIIDKIKNIIQGIKEIKIIYK